MYVYIQSEKYLWTVGFYGPQGFWHPESDHDSPEEAAKRVALLNGSSAEMTREDFMEFFRDDEKLNTLSPDDRVEIFSSILLGGCDITKELLEEILGNYGVDNLEVIETN